MKDFNNCPKVPGLSKCTPVTRALQIGLVQPGIANFDVQPGISGRGFEKMGMHEIFEVGANAMAVFPVQPPGSQIAGLHSRSSFQLI
jgi:hypothetical protein